MKKNNLFLLPFILFALLMTGGCDGTQSTHTPSEDKTDIYVIGTVEETAFENAQMGATGYGGIAADKPIVISHTELMKFDENGSLVNKNMKGIRAAYQNYQEIAVLNTSYQSLNAVRVCEILEYVVGYTAEKPLYDNLLAVSGEAAIDGYAVLKESDDVIHRYSFIYANRSADPASMDIERKDAQESALSGMRLFFDDEYTPDVTPQMKETALEAVTAVAGPGQTLEEMTQWNSNIQEMKDGVTGKTFVLNTKIIAVHVFEDGGSQSGYDYYWVLQEAAANGEPSYSKANRSVYNYMKVFEIETQLSKKLGTANPENFGDQFIYTNPSPTATNGAITQSSSIGWSLGASIGGMRAPNATPFPQLSGSINASKTTSWAQQDVSGQADLSLKGSRVKWTYNYRGPTYTWSWPTLDVKAGALLGHSLFVPVHQWVWKVPTKYRYNFFGTDNAINSFTTTMYAYTGSYYAYSNGFNAGEEHTDVSKTRETMLHPLPVPPLLAVDQPSITFGKKEGYKKIIVSGQGGIEFKKVNPNDTWYTLDLNAKELIITVMENNTGVSRRAEIKVSKPWQGNLDIAYNTQAVINEEAPKILPIFQSFANPQ